MGLIEKEWLDTLNCIGPEDVEYVDFVQAGTTLSTMLREVEHCDVVIALTHMRTSNDERLAMRVPGIDIVLGGHDHDYWFKVASVGGHQVRRFVLVVVVVVVVVVVAAAVTRSQLRLVVAVRSASL